MWKITLDISRMLSREDGTMYETNKQTNKQLHTIHMSFESGHLAYYFSTV
jgi:hypothetical protein